MPLSSPMTDASQQLANALQELSKAPAQKGECATSPVPATFDTHDSGLAFPLSVAEFLDEMHRYTESAKSVSVGVY